MANKVKAEQKKETDVTKTLSSVIEHKPLHGVVSLSDESSGSHNSAFHDTVHASHADKLDLAQVTARMRAVIEGYQKKVAELEMLLETERSKNKELSAKH
jgi:predicted RNase H-like nuclease (RuvC/YqgF family)